MAHNWSSSRSKSSADPAWWIRPCSISIATGCARRNLPRIAWTFLYGTFGSTWRSAVTSQSPPDWSSKTTQSAE